MGFDFRETLTLEVPHVEEQMSAFSESTYKKDHGLIIEVAAIHEGMTANFNFYPAASLEGALQSWTSPYLKPIIMNHDPRTEAIGRVIGARMAQEADGTPYTLLQAAITDPVAISKVMDQRYLTGSVGGSATEANCSVCGADWAEASVANIPCKHQRGKTYKGKLAYMEMNGITFKEYSIVNMPADERSSIRSISTTTAVEAEEGWVRPARFFSLDMGKEEIVEFSESKNQNVLEGLKKKESTPVYTNLKGAFLSALVAEEGSEDSEDLSTKESTVPDQLMDEEEDILGTVENLSSDLATPVVVAEEEETPEEESAADEEETTDEDSKDSEVGSTDEDEEPEASGEESEETEEEEATAEEGGDRPEGQEKPDPETPVSREDDDEESDTSDEEKDKEEKTDEADGAETDLGEATSALESRVAELEARESALLEENGKLKAALKRNLAERVVDAKIARGMFEADVRDAQIEEHVNRSASSLADSLRDFAAMPVVAQTQEKSILDGPVVEETSAAVEDENTLTEGDDDYQPEEKDEPVEDVLVDVFMGRRSLQF